MNVAQKMDEHKARLVERDKERAIEALVEYIHYEITPRAFRKGYDPSSVMLFDGNDTVNVFCESKQIPAYALSWVLNDLTRDGLCEEVEPGGYRLLENGIRRYCVSKLN